MRKKDRKIHCFANIYAIDFLDIREKCSVFLLLLSICFQRSLFISQFIYIQQLIGSNEQHSFYMKLTKNNPVLSSTHRIRNIKHVWYICQVFEQIVSVDYIVETVWAEIDFLLKLYWIIPSFKHRTRRR